MRSFAFSLDTVSVPDRATRRPRTSEASSSYDPPYVSEPGSPYAPEYGSPYDSADDSVDDRQDLSDRLRQGRTGRRAESDLSDDYDEDEDEGEDEDLWHNGLLRLGIVVSSVVLLLFSCLWALGSASSDHSDTAGAEPASSSTGPDTTPSGPEPTSQASDAVIAKPTPAPTKPKPSVTPTKKPGTGTAVSRKTPSTSRTRKAQPAQVTKPTRVAVPTRAASAPGPRCSADVMTTGLEGAVGLTTVAVRNSGTVPLSAWNAVLSLPAGYGLVGVQGGEADASDPRAVRVRNYSGSGYLAPGESTAIILMLDQPTGVAGTTCSAL